MSLTISRDPALEATHNTLFDRNNNFIDYFLIIGLKPSIITSQTFTKCVRAEVLNSLIKPSIISKFPEYNKKSLYIDNSIIKYIFPNGFKAIESSTPPPNQTFNLILDNTFFSRSFPHIYVTCMIIHENFYQYKQLSSLYKAKTSHSSKNVNPNKKNNITTFTRASELISIYIPKCLCFVSMYPYFDYFTLLLDKVYNSASGRNAEGNEMLFDKIIETIVCCIPALPRGQSEVSLHFLGETINLRQNELNKLPLININLNVIFDTFIDKNNIIEVYKHLLYESRIIFFSEDIDKLTLVIYGFISLLFPFKYRYKVSSVLPKEYFYLLQNTSTPYIYGINLKYSEQLLNELNIETAVLIVDADRDYVLYYKASPLLLTNVSSLNNESLIISNDTTSDMVVAVNELPKRIKAKIEKAIKKIKKEHDVKNGFIQEKFLHVLMTIFENYTKYIITDNITYQSLTDIKKLINIDTYINSVSKDEKDFYMKILNTEMFKEFLIDRILPDLSKDQLEALYFDEKILEKTQKKRIFSKQKQTYLLSNTNYNIVNSIPINIPKQTKLSETDVNFLSKEISSTDLLLKGININLSPSQTTCTFDYILFPSLASYQLFKNNINSYNTATNLLEAFNETNKALLSSTTNFIININSINKMGNYIYNSYLLIFACCFNYIKTEDEKTFRFNQLMNIIDLTETYNNDITIYEYIFKALHKLNYDYFIICLYRKLIQKRINPSALIYTIISKIYEEHNKKKLSLNTNQFMLLEQAYWSYNKETNDMTLPTNNNKFLMERTLKDVNDMTRVVSQHVEFNPHEMCIECKKVINLYQQSINLDDIPLDEQWVKCVNCNKNILAKVNVQFGIELFNEDVSIESSAVKESVLLYSPKMLNEKLIKVIKAYDGVEFPINEFKIRHKIIYWNLLWYFKIMNIDISIMLPYEDEASRLVNKYQEQIPFFKSLNDKKNKTFINRSASIPNINYFNNSNNSNNSNTGSNSNSTSNLISRSCLQFYKSGINESYLSTTSDNNGDITSCSSGEIFKSYTSLINMTYYRSDLIVQTVCQFDIVPYIGIIASPTTQITFIQNSNHNHSLFFVVNFP